MNLNEMVTILRPAPEEDEPFRYDFVAEGKIARLVLAVEGAQAAPSKINVVARARNEHKDASTIVLVRREDGECWVVESVVAASRGSLDWLHELQNQQVLVLEEWEVPGFRRIRARFEGPAAYGAFLFGVAAAKGGGDAPAELMALLSNPIKGLRDLVSLCEEANELASSYAGYNQNSFSFSFEENSEEKGRIAWYCAPGDPRLPPTSIYAEAGVGDDLRVIIDGRARGVYSRWPWVRREINLESEFRLEVHDLVQLPAITV